MKRIWGIPLVALLLTLLSSCAEGNSQTDGEARRVADAISYPLNQIAGRTTAEGFARAALATSLGRSSNLSVLEAKDIPAKGPQDVSAHLVFRIHHDGSQGAMFNTAPINACYSVDFNYHGIANGPSRVGCPANAVAITLPPAPPPAQVPGTFEAPLQAILTALPANTTEPDILAALSHGMPALKPDPETHLTGKAPDVAVTVRGGTDVGVSYRTMDSTNGVQCLLGSRIQGNVLVWRPSWRQVQPGELTCTPETALSRDGVKPPH